MRLVQWIVLMNSDNLKDGNHMINNPGHMFKRGDLVLDGIKLATEIKRDLKQYLMLYEMNGKVLDQRNLPKVI